MGTLKSIYASAYSAALTIIIVVGMTIGADLSPSFKTWLTGFTGHHWVTKSWVSVLSFLVFFFLIRFARKLVNEFQTKRSLITLEITAILGFIAILGFYVYEFLAK